MDDKRCMIKSILVFMIAASLATPSISLLPSAECANGGQRTEKFILQEMINKKKVPYRDGSITLLISWKQNHDLPQIQLFL